ncbi:hypothetical protein HNQ56_003831 [Anaerotaenia torta]|uniref:ROK family protein n=1 Tax=Anaerotaenia torta TaxID=433293 RepID=UPI003D1B921B
MLDELKSQNISSILLLLLSNENATKSDLVRETKFGNSTVSSAINELTHANLVTSIGKEDSIGGRRSIIYKINEAYGWFIGITLKKEAFEFVVTDCQNRIAAAWTTPYDKQVPAISVLLRELEKGMDTYQNVLGIGVGLNGQIDYEAQVVVSCEDLNWNYVHLKESIEREFLVYTVVDHYINGAAKREHYLGSAKKIQNYIYYNELVPEKMAVVLNGVLCRGRYNLAGKLDGSSVEFYQKLEQIKGHWDVEKVFVAGGMESRVSNCANAKDVVRLGAEDYCLARGMAAQAEIKWFKRALGKSKVS